MRKIRQDVGRRKKKKCWIASLKLFNTLFYYICASAIRLFRLLDRQLIEDFSILINSG